MNMAAAKGNKNAEVWTVEKARETAQAAYEAISDDCYFLSSLAEKVGTYRQLFEYLMNKYNDDKIVFNTIKKIYNKCESIVVEQTAKSKINPALGIFVLKAYHGLFETSKQHLDHTTQGEKLSITLTTEDVKL